MAPGRVINEEIYDYIICGGGTSGSVVAGRLAEDGNVTILVVEAGADNADLENTQMAGGWSQNFDADTDWNIITVIMPRSMLVLRLISVIRNPCQASTTAQSRAAVADISEEAVDAMALCAFVEPSRTTTTGVYPAGVARKCSVAWPRYEAIMFCTWLV